MPPGVRPRRGRYPRRYNERVPEQLKPYLLPIVALILVAAWFLIIQPMMTKSEPAPPGNEKAAGETGGQ